MAITFIVLNLKYLNVRCKGDGRSAVGRERKMSIDRAVLMLAGFVVLNSLALGFYVSSYWYLLTAFAGLNMIQASVTGFCPAAIIFKKLGCKAGVAFK